MTTETESGDTLTIFRGLFRELRPWQWYKQGVMLFGIVFSKNLFDFSKWIFLLMGIASFTAVVGAVYVFNDIADLKEDRKHPEKQHRPMASGQIPITVGAIYGVGLLIGGLVAAYWLGLLFLTVVLAYLVQNVFYSLYFKQVILIDVIIVAVGFVLRAIAGVVAINVELSPWLIVSTFLVALVLAFGKRRHELAGADEPAEVRAVLGEYSLETIDNLLVVVMATLLMAYSLYSFFRVDSTMMITLPFAFFGVFRYYHLVKTSDVAGQPEYLLTDRQSVLNLLLWGLIAIGVLYNVPDVLITVLS